LPAKPVTDAAAKREKANAYVEGLLKNGDPSTDVFRKALGEQKNSRTVPKGAVRYGGII
jgi:hypothetical protein